MRGFDYCRPEVVVDGAQFGEAYKGTFVSASTLDGADEIPCAHAFAIFKKKNIIDIHLYCSDYYKLVALANTYEVPIVLMPDKEDWSAPEFVLEEIVLSPRYKRLAGRPRKKRKKIPREKISTNTNHYGRCGHEGHNIRTCTFFPKED
ncbi:uncharacterized protein LOC125873580 [Solanum stenotomum]|uniref:uncharacterized protein LOC125873580 n=1 Tax=Solanum stenotomum TaxID=172797 RepID=UPI0020D189C3|nr:uncharacterized protein LOC125873580 [Solanum stenotomum]